MQMGKFQLYNDTSAVHVGEFVGMLRVAKLTHSENY